MTGRRHQEKDDKREEPERLEGELGEAAKPCIAYEQRDQWIQIALAVKLDERKRAVRQPKEERRYTQMAAVIEQGQELAIQPAKRPDAKDDMQQQKRSSA